MAKRINNYSANLLNKLAGILDVSNFILYGGSALDLILNREIRDYDIAFEESHGVNLSKLQRTLEKKDYKILEVNREYYVQMNKLVKLLYAENSPWILDIAIVESYEHIGLFNIDSIYIKYPEVEIVDRHNAVGAHQKKSMKLIRHVDDENPLMITARLLSLCAKYDLPLESFKQLISQLKNKLNNWDPPNDFHGSIAEASAVSSVLKAIARSKDAQKFSKSLLQTNILQCIFPEIIPSLEALHSRESYNWGVDDKKHLVKVLLNANISKDDKLSLQKRLKTLEVRKWDSTDARLTNS